MSENKHQPYLVAGIGIIGVLLGSIVGHYFSLSQEKQSLLEEARRQGYIEFLESQQLYAEFKEANRLGNDEKADRFREQWHLKQQGAINKIATYGDTNVVKALADFYRKYHPVDKCKENWQDDIEIYQNMRQSLLGEDDPASDHDLAELILKCSTNNTN